MGKYQINPHSVQRVLRATRADAAEFSKIVKPLAGSVESAATSTGSSAVIVAALEDFFEVQEKRVKGISTRVGACLSGAAEATQAYVNADWEMVSTYQAAAVKAANQPPR